MEISAVNIAKLTLGFCIYNSRALIAFVLIFAGVFWVLSVAVSDMIETSPLTVIVFLILPLWVFLRFSVLVQTAILTDRDLSLRNMIPPSRSELRLFFALFVVWIFQGLQRILSDLALLNAVTVSQHVGWAVLLVVSALAYYVSLRLSLAPSIAAGRGDEHYILKSWQLTKGHLVKIFLSLLLVGLVLSIPLVVVGIPLMIAEEQGATRQYAWAITLFFVTYIASAYVLMFVPLGFIAKGLLTRDPDEVVLPSVRL